MTTMLRHGVVRVLCALAAISLLSGCGARTAPDGPVARVGAPSHAAVSSPDAVSTASPDDELSAGAPLSSSPAAAEDDAWDVQRQEAAFARMEQDNRGFRLTVRHACRRHGELQEVDVVTAPSSNISLVVGYRDGEPHGAMFVGQSDPHGHFTWEFLVAAHAPQGPAVVLGSGPGDHETGEGGGSAHGRFTVAGPDGC